MKSVVVDTTLHAKAGLMEEFKASKHSKWDPDYEIGFWKEREAKLVKGGEEGDVAGELSPPRLRV